MRRSPLLLSLLTYASALLASSLLLAATAQAASTAHKKHGSAHSNAHPKPKAKVRKGDKAPPTGASYGAREDAQLWAQEVAKRLDLPEGWATTVGPIIIVTGALLFVIAIIEAIRSDDPTALTGLPLIALTTMLRNAGMPFFSE